MKNIFSYMIFFILSCGFVLSSGFLFAEEHQHSHEEHEVHLDDDHHQHAEENHEHEKEGHEHHEDEHGEHEGSKFGPGKAILEVKHEGERFKLSPDAEKVMGIKIQTLVNTDKTKTFSVPKGSIVYYQEKTGVYREHDSWYELIDIMVTEINSNEMLISSEKLNAHDQIVVSGLGLLRVAHLEASGQGGQGHAH